MYKARSIVYALTLGLAVVYCGFVGYVAGMTFGIVAAPFSGLLSFFFMIGLLHVVDEATR